jgi:hypothetical protein
MAERHVREGEERVQRQQAVIARLSADNQLEAAQRAQSVLRNMKRSLALSVEHLQRLRAERSDSD